MLKQTWSWKLQAAGLCKYVWPFSEHQASKCSIISLCKDHWLDFSRKVMNWSSLLHLEWTCIELNSYIISGQFSPFVHKWRNWNKLHSKACQQFGRRNCKRFRNPCKVGLFRSKEYHKLRHNQWYNLSNESLSRKGSECEPRYYVGYLHTHK